MGSVLDNLANDTLDLFQFFHQVGVGLQSTGGVHDNRIGVSGHSSLHCIECHRGRVGTAFLPHAGDINTFSPGLQLLDRRRTKGITRGQNHLLALPFPFCRKLADGGRLARSIDPDYQDDTRPVYV